MKINYNEFFLLAVNELSFEVIFSIHSIPVPSIFNVKKVEPSHVGGLEEV